MPVKNIYEQLETIRNSGNNKDWFKPISILSMNTHIKKPLIDLPDKEIHFDGALVYNLYKGKNKPKAVDTILPRECGLYLVDFKDRDKESTNDDKEHIAQQFTSSVSIINEYFKIKNENKDMLSSKSFYYVFNNINKENETENPRPYRRSFGAELEDITVSGKNIIVKDCSLFKEWYKKLSCFLNMHM